MGRKRSRRREGEEEGEEKEGERRGDKEEMPHTPSTSTLGRKTEYPKQLFFPLDFPKRFRKSRFSPNSTVGRKIEYPKNSPPTSTPTPMMREEEEEGKQERI